MDILISGEARLTSVLPKMIREQGKTKLVLVILKLK